jgi:NADPH2:quinone reductase
MRDGEPRAAPARPGDPAALLFFYNPSPNQSLHVFNLGLWFGLRPKAAVTALRDLIGYAASGQVKVAIGQTLPLARAADAHRLLEARQSVGKVILKPWVEG